MNDRSYLWELEWAVEDGSGKEIYDPTFEEALFALNQLDGESCTSLAITHFTQAPILFIKGGGQIGYSVEFAKGLESFMAINEKAKAGTKTFINFGVDVTLENNQFVEKITAKDIVKCFMENQQMLESQTWLKNYPGPKN